MKRSLAILVSALSISAMTVPMTLPVWAEAADTKEEASDTQDLEDGVYIVDFNTDSSMFHTNEACEGKGQLTVEDGKMTLHITLVSENIVNLFPGVAEDAQKDDAELLQPTTDTVTYKDGTSDEVYGFDVPVEALDQDFDLAIIGTKGKWYDHTVSVSNPEEMNDDNKLPVEVAEDEAEDTENGAVRPCENERSGECEEEAEADEGAIAMLVAHFSSDQCKERADAIVYAKEQVAEIL